MSKSERPEIAELAARRKLELDQRPNDALMDIFPCSDPIAIYIPSLEQSDAERAMLPANRHHDADLGSTSDAELDRQ